MKIIFTFNKTTTIRPTSISPSLSSLSQTQRPTLRTSLSAQSLLHTAQQPVFTVPLSNNGTIQIQQFAFLTFSIHLLKHVHFCALRSTIPNIQQKPFNATQTITQNPPTTLVQTNIGTIAASNTPATVNRVVPNTGSTLSNLFYLCETDFDTWKKDSFNIETLLSKF